MSDRYDARFNNGGHELESGQLDSNAPYRSGGKKVFDWQFRLRDATKTSIPIEVHLITDDNGAPTFKASSENMPPIINSDIKILHQLVDRYFKSHVDAISDIKWEGWLEIVVKGSDSSFEDSKYSAFGSSLHIQVNKIQRGQHPETGEWVTVNRNGVIMKFPEPKIMRAEKFADNWLRDPPEEHAYLPDTPENMMALEEIMRRMKVLRESLASFLNQDAVENNLVELERKLPLLLK